MSVKEEVNEKIVIKDELPDDDSVTVPLSGLVQYRSITQQCMKMEHTDSDDDVSCPCEECTGRVWVQGAEEPGLTVKLEAGDGSMSHPTELNGQPMTPDCPDVSLNLPPDNLASFFDDDEDANIDNSPSTARNTFCWCLTCGKTFAEKRSLKVHYFRAHSAEMPFNCLICGKKYKSKQEVESHQRVHDPARSTVHCTHCQAPFTRMRELLLHQESNDCQRKVQTTTASQESSQGVPLDGLQLVPSFPPYGSTLENLQGINYSPINGTQMELAASSLMTPEQAGKVTPPVDSTGGKSKSSIYQCAICKKIFLTEASFNQHKQMFSGERPLSCCTSGRTFTQEGHWRRHERLHSKEDPYIGAICEGKCTQNDELQMHQRVHYPQMNGQQKEVVTPSSSTPEGAGNLSGNTGQLVSNTEASEALVTSQEAIGVQNNAPLNQSTTCGKSFTTKGTLKGHRQIPSGEKPFSCSTCGKSFTYNSNRGKHERICGGNYTQNEELQMHKEIHEPDRRRAKCSDCGVSFIRWKNLEIHREGNYCQARRGTASSTTPFQMNPFVPLLEGFPEAGQKTSGSLPLGFLNYGEIDAQPEEVIPSSTARKRTEISTPLESPDVIPLFVCSTCGKAFVKKKNLKRHTRLHNDKRYKCSVCGKVFKHKATCDYHQFHTHPLDEGKLRCTICNGAFDWSSLKINHRADCSVYIVSRKGR